MTTDVDLRPAGGVGACCPSRNVVSVTAALPACGAAETCNHRGEGRRRCTNPCLQRVVCQTEMGVAAAVPASARRLSLAEHFRDPNPWLAQRHYRNLKPSVLKPAGTSPIPLACARPLSLYVSRARVGVCGGVRILAWATTLLAEGPPLHGQPKLKKGSPVPGRAGRTRHHHSRRERGANRPSGSGQCPALFPMRLARACWAVRRCADFGMGNHPSGRRTPFTWPTQIEKGSPLPGRAGRIRHHHPRRERRANHLSGPGQCLAIFPIRLAQYVSRARVGVCGGVRILAWATTHLAEGPPSYGQLRLKKGSPVPGRAGRTRHHHSRRERGANHPSGPGQCLALFPIRLAQYVSRTRVGVYGGVRILAWPPTLHAEGPPSYGQPKLKKRIHIRGRAGRDRQHHARRESARIRLSDRVGL